MAALSGEEQQTTCTTNLGRNLVPMASEDIVAFARLAVIADQNHDYQAAIDNYAKAISAVLVEVSMNKSLSDKQV